MMEDRKRYYANQFTQATSPCGDFLVLGGSYRRIVILDLDAALNSKQEDVRKKSEEALLGQIGNSKPGYNSNEQIFCSASTPHHFICGSSEGTVSGYEWSDLTESAGNPRPAWSFVVTEGGSNGSPAEVNVTKVSEDEEKLLTAGAGDNHLKMWDLETRRKTISLKGHEDYVHGAVFKGPNEICSCSEDGSVRIWDLRSGLSERVLRPSGSKCKRNLGDYISCIAVDGDWIICGGGPSLGIWHSGSMSLAAAMNDKDVEHRDIFILDDKIISGGSKSKLFHWNFSGELVNEVPTSMATTYSIQLSQKSADFKIMTSVGSSSKVDFYIDPAYKAFSLETWL